MATRTALMNHAKITGSQWKSIVKHLLGHARTGRPGCGDRTAVNGIPFVPNVGCRLAEIPRKYGSKSTAHLGLQNRQQKGIWKSILSGLIKTAHKPDKLNSKNTS